MAKTTTVTVTDDIDGSANATEIEFSYRGTNYVIDLGKKNLAAFDKAIKPYVDAGTKVPSRGRAAVAPVRGRRGTSTGPGNRPEVQRIREWATSNGIAVNARGRISQAVRDQYEAAK